MRIGHAYQVGNVRTFSAESSAVTTLSARLTTVLAAAMICSGLGAVSAQAAPSPVTASATCANQGALVYTDSTTSYTPDCGTGYRIKAHTKRLRWDGYSGGSPVKSARMQSEVRFESNTGNGRDARNTRVTCTDNYGGHDSDGEGKATSTTVTYNTPGIPPGAPVTVTCTHEATYNNVTYSTSTVQMLYAPIPYP
jgi:hypothetical protein